MIAIACKEILGSLRREAVTPTHEDHTRRILAAAAETLQLWDTEISYPDLAEDIAAEARLALALTAEIRDLDTKIASLLLLAGR